MLSSRRTAKKRQNFALTPASKERKREKGPSLDGRTKQKAQRILRRTGDKMGEMRKHSGVAELKGSLPRRKKE